jgi:hypothetical protein
MTRPKQKAPPKKGFENSFAPDLPSHRFEESVLIDVVLVGRQNDATAANQVLRWDSADAPL